MLEDLDRMFSKTFGWVGSILPLGLKFGSIGLLVTAAFLWLNWKTLGMITFALSVLCAYFFRDPKRETQFADDEIASPADGTILSIKTEEDPHSVVIRIFLSIFDVHVQRCPVNGKTGMIFYNKGTFLFADNPDANKNERNLIQIFKDGDPSRYAHVEQITGAIARRIECWAQAQTTIMQGAHLGLVRFGSQVAVYLPKDRVHIVVKEGQKVQGNISVLALWK